jgi:two-component system, OmpR family, sensor kinase
MGFDGACAWLRVEDTGPGISVEDQTRVFDPFYRALGSNVEGSGLGLSIVDSITKRLNSRIRMLNIPSGGLQVTVSFATSIK